LRARKHHTRPDWPDTTQAHVDYFAGEFESSLKLISERFARHEEAINVDPRHVNEAFSSLSRLGLSRVPWWKRTELEVGIGSFLFSLGLAAPDVLTRFLNERVTDAVLAALLLIGSLIAIRGWLRGSRY
jgi:hypothetical protein